MSTELDESAERLVEAMDDYVAATHRLLLFIKANESKFAAGGSDSSPSRSDDGN